MKIRTDFVTNSSSSSFVISKDKLTEDQIFAIKNHGTIGRVFQDIIFDPGYYCDDPWTIKEDGNNIYGNTNMDNFEMFTYLEAIGVNDENIKWGD